MNLIQMHELQLKNSKSLFKTTANFSRTIGIIEEYHPDQIAIEAPLWKNVQSMLKLGRAQGVMAAGLYREIPITDIPQENKNGYN